jgi:hypothetical protein
VKKWESYYKAYGTTCRRQKGHGLPIIKWYGMSSCLRPLRPLARRPAIIQLEQFKEASSKPAQLYDFSNLLITTNSSFKFKFCLFYIRSELLFRINYNFYFGNVLSCSVVSFAFRTSTLVLEFHSLALWCLNPWLGIFFIDCIFWGIYKNANCILQFV